MKEVYIVPHSHWDREWYLPFEHHRLRLVWLMDELLDTLEVNEEYKHFHLDGQTIVIDDYLEIKPHMKEKIIKYIGEGRLSVGPWYILQDEYLISGEANIRNMLIGYRESAKYGKVCKVGYFPDAFGNISQGPQILKGFGIDNAVFGRGINSVGFNNTVVSKTTVEEYPTELLWQSPDGSLVLGVFMANWYNNAMEIPENKEEAIEFLKNAIKNSTKLATTDRLLLMNGCDHQPPQVGLPEIIKQVQPLIGDVHLMQSGLENYIEDLKKDVGTLKTYEGEMNGQFTDGWWTLCNTASARVYLKQMNHESQSLLENYTEPVEVLAYINGKSYEKEMITHSWKKLLQNHPHDSICGCSVDEVHDEMVTRFNKTMQLSHALLDESLEYLFGERIIESIDVEKISFSVLNPSNWSRSGVVEVKIDVPNDQELKNPIVIDKDGNVVPASIVDKGVAFNYRLPKDKFRKVDYVHRYQLHVLVSDIPQLGMERFWLKSDDSELSFIGTDGDKAEADLPSLENDFFIININKNGSLVITDKETGKVYQDMNVYEDVGDVGNEYIFKSPEKDCIVTTKDSHALIEEVVKNSLKTVYKITQEISLPIKCDKKTSKRVEEMIKSTIITKVTLVSNVKRIDIKTTIDNRWEDHRFRALFPTGLESTYHYAHGQFDVIKRTNVPWEGWKNPSYCQKQRYFVDMNDGATGLMIANKGLAEYEILNNDTIALTLLRSVGELGDWGEFPTPGAQCIGEQTVEYSIIPHGGDWCESKAYREAYELNLPLIAKQEIDSTNYNETFPFAFSDDNIVVTAIKKCEERESIVARLYNISNDMISFSTSLTDLVNEVYEVNLNEGRLVKMDIKGKSMVNEIKGKEIKTYEYVLK
ncbi:alpha-mannosidase [Vallitalea okinawensis]|uniref:alpha-mannosidase n=1 Tax=Vallitalea okinawensis TaxID=2078660 RepID=UPI000CFD2286|nr:glycoside hydrolase family 38 C-terminal domain-containing protein [Vallitalea okinawensis]